VPLRGTRPAKAGAYEIPRDLLRKDLLFKEKRGEARSALFLLKLLTVIKSFALSGSRFAPVCASSRSASLVAQTPRLGKAGNVNSTLRAQCV
jgi:hypothetical protein